MILAPVSDIYAGTPTALTYATVPAAATTIPGTTYINYIPQTRKRGFVTTESVSIVSVVVHYQKLLVLV